MITNEVTAAKISTPCIRKCNLINDHCVSCGRRKDSAFCGLA